MQDDTLEYAGFWVRVGAMLIDTLLMVAVLLPLIFLFYGAAYFDPEDTRLIKGPADGLISYVLPALLTIGFWLAKQATPGKMAVGARVVDAQTGSPMSAGQAVGRYFAYILSTIPLGLGFFWIAFDARKQGWHDKLAGTVVVRNAAGTTQPVSFGGR
jgi:uncharacterized RDD family membrane protein YckC